MSILLGVKALQRGPTRPDINDLHANDAFCAASSAACGTLNGVHTHISTVYFYKVRYSDLTDMPAATIQNKVIIGYWR